MTPKEKAEELVDKYLNASFNCKDCDMPYCDIKCTMLSKREAKVCALIVVDEMLSLRYLLKKETWFYKEVKKEIEKL